MLANLGIRREIPGPQPVAQHGRGFSFGGVEVVCARGLEPVRPRFLTGRNQRLENPPGGLAGDLLPQASSKPRGKRYRLRYLSCNIEVPPRQVLSALGVSDSPGRDRRSQARESAQTASGDQEERAPAGEIRQDVGLGGGIDRADRVDHDRRAATPFEQPFHGLAHAVIGRHAVDDEERVTCVVAIENLARVGAAEHVEFVLLQSEVRRRLSLKLRSDRQND